MRPNISIGATLVLLILKEKHPEVMPRAELEARFRDLIKEHGSMEKAVEYMRGRLKQ